jgi:methylated-DNA-[protein]-cysteine S-methyltransferase
VTSTVGEPGVSALLGITAPGDRELRHLHDRLVTAADEDGILDIGYTTIDSPVGPLLVAATSKGLVRVAYQSEDHDRVLSTLASRISPRILRDPKRLDAAAREIGEYFAGRRTVFDLPLDFSLSHGFRQVVQQQLPQIGYGKTRSYGEVAAMVGKPKAVRAVGTACATNPVPIVVPCHRVVRADGTLGGYAGGPEAKRTLLTLERAA